MILKKISQEEYDRLVEYVRQLFGVDEAEGRGAYVLQPNRSLTRQEEEYLLRRLASDSKKAANSALRTLICLTEICQAPPGSESERERKKLRKWLRKTMITDPSAVLPRSSSSAGRS